MGLAFIGYAMDYDTISGCTPDGTMETTQTDEGSTLSFTPAVIGMG